MPALQFSYCENLRISFEHKHNTEMIGEKQVRLSERLCIQNCLRLSLFHVHDIYCVHFQTIKHIIYSETIQ